MVCYWVIIQFLNMDRVSDKTKNSPINSKIMTRSKVKNSSIINNSPKNIKLNNNCTVNKSQEKTVGTQVLKGKEKGKSEIKSVQIQTDIFFSNIQNVNELLGKQWITDNTIQHYFDLINNKLLMGTPFTIVNPLIVHGVKNVIDFNHFLDPLKLQEKNILIMPINDSTSLTQAGGSHWSVLLYDKCMNRFLHYDSLDNHNLSSALTVAEKINFYLTGQPECTNFTSVKGPKQFNTYDCGIYMILAVEAMVMSVIESKVVTVDLFTRWMVKEVDLIKKRSTLAYILNNTSSITKEILVTLLQDLISKQTQGVTEYCTHSNAAGNNATSKGVTKSCPNIMKVSGEGVVPHFVTDLYPERLKEPPVMNLQSHSNKSSTVRPKLTLACDSQGRGLSYYLDMTNSNKFKIYNHVQPGATLEAITNAALNVSEFNAYTKNDYIVIIGGTNNMSSKNKCCPVKTMTNCLKGNVPLFQHTNLILSTIPYRYDLREYSYENKAIKEINFVIRELAYTHKHVRLLDLSLLRRCYHTSHGFHVNRRGKQFISKEISHLTIAGKSHSFCYFKDPVPASDNTTNKRLPTPTEELPIIDNRTARPRPTSSSGIALVSFTTGHHSKQSNVLDVPEVSCGGSSLAPAHDNTSNVFYGLETTKLEEAKGIRQTVDRDSSGSSQDFKGFFTPSKNKLNSIQRKVKEVVSLQEHLESDRDTNGEEIYFNTSPLPLNCLQEGAVTAT